MAESWGPRLAMVSLGAACSMARVAPVRERPSAGAAAVDERSRAARDPGG